MEMELALYLYFTTTRFTFYEMQTRTLLLIYNDKYFGLWTTNGLC